MKRSPSDENERPVASAGSVAAGIRRCIAEYEQIAWGWDGDCGANDIISRIEEECDRIDAARPASTLSDAERQDIRVWLAECLRQCSTATEGCNEELAERWQERAKRAAAMIERLGGGR